MDYQFVHGGNTFSLPPFKSIKSGHIRAIRKLAGEDAMYTLLEQVAPEDSLAATDDMTIDELAEVIEGWTQHSGVGLGESSASST